MTDKATHILWFKRDLRTYDHKPLSMAAMAGNRVVPLYVVEPAYWALPDTSARQYDFLRECLLGLSEELGGLGAPLRVMVGDVVEVLQGLQERFGSLRLFSHEETGNGWTFDRDLRVKAWCAANAVEWQEVPQHGVVRPLKSRDGWAAHWDRFMAQPCIPQPEQLAPPEQLSSADSPVRQTIPTAKELGLACDPCPNRQRGGRVVALDLLDSFLEKRGERYRAAMSTPLEGEWACSRLSPYLALGCLSMREAAQATWQAQKEAKLSAPKGSMWRGSLQSFSARLHWHCHFIQKLEGEPRLEQQNLHPAYDGLRPETPNAERLQAWADGETGLPFLDACMRFLKATGWLNFRMRAMVMAVASYHLWLPWRETGLILARRFVDYEPGIHWSQVQMQSGTTGINTPRIYNPVKQGEDQDPSGVFTRRWVPELAAVPDTHLQSPWLWNGAGSVLGKTYPIPIIDPKAAAKEAREKIWAIRRGTGYREAAQEIVSKHGSRKNNDRDGGGRRKRGQATKKPDQLPLFGDQ